MRLELVKSQALSVNGCVPRHGRDEWVSCKQCRGAIRGLVESVTPVILVFSCTRLNLITSPARVSMASTSRCDLGAAIVSSSSKAVPKGILFIVTMVSLL